MRRVIAIVLLLSAICLLAGCNREYTPDPAVREYLNNGMTAEKAYAQLATATYTETRTIQNKQGDVRGTFRSEVSIDKTDESNLGMTIHTVYDGDCIEDDNLIEMKATLAKTDGTYKYTVEKTFVGGASPSETVEEMEEQDARNLVVAVVYTDNSVYDEGLYYGDLYMLRIYRFPPESFYVDEEEDLCVFDEGMLIKDYYDLEDVELHQLTKINRLGLLVYNYEKYIGIKSDYVLISETTPTYTYLDTEDK